MADPRFQEGDLVAHRAYGYRGVVAGSDPVCRADDAWYRSNRTQPTRLQPWYHVLVHGTATTTYVAEENLEEYEGGEQVLHPMTVPLFAAFSEGRYLPRENVRFPSPWQ